MLDRVFTIIAGRIAAFAGLPLSFVPAGVIQTSSMLL